LSAWPSLSSSRWDLERRACATPAHPNYAGIVSSAEIPAEIQLLDEGIDEIDATKIEADLVGITAITGTAPRAYELARIFRDRGIPVVLGGVHPTLMPKKPPPMPMPS